MGCTKGLGPEALSAGEIGLLGCGINALGRRTRLHPHSLLNYTCMVSSTSFTSLLSILDLGLGLRLKSPLSDPHGQPVVTKSSLPSQT